MTQIDLRRGLSPVRLTVWAAFGLATGVAIVACGGGGGDTSATTQSTGRVQVQVTDGPDTDASHVWVTLTEIWMNASNTAEAGDANWQKLVLPQPVTVDLNQLSNGALSSILGTLTVPVGTYQQMRLLLAASDGSLTSSAQAAGLTWNDQVSYTDSTGAARSAPIEIAQATQGITLLGSFVVTSSSTLNLAVEFDVGNDLVRYHHDGIDAFTLLPRLKYFDLNAAGAIVGKIDTSTCASALPNPCADFVAKVETPSKDGTRYVGARWTSVAADGSFVLYPVPTTSATYDLVVRGRYAQTMVVQDVPVTAGTTPTRSPTTVSAVPLAVQPASEFNVNFASGANPTGAHAGFLQTVGRSLPYEIRTHQLNPFSGNFSDDYGLVGGAVLLGSYLASGNPSFTATTPGEGMGTYAVDLAGWGLTRASAGPVSASTDGSTTEMTMPTLTPGTNVAGFGQISGTLTQSVPGQYDQGDLVVAHGGVIENAMDISSVLQANAGAGGSYLIDHLPAGSATQHIGSNGNGRGIYYAYLRVWNSATPTVVKLVDVPGMADLDAASSATLNVTVP